MDIKILPKENSSIIKKINFTLGKYTIFAGENNAGKTNLMKALKDFLPSDQTIYIPAESIQAQDHLKTTAETDPMRDALSKLIDITFRELPVINYDDIEDFLSKISDTFDSFNVENIELELGVKKLNENDIGKIIKNDLSKKILSSVIKDSYGAGCDLKIGEVGQGTQRLIIVAILQELSKVKSSNGELFLIFEEPEIYLHPKLKRTLYNSLLEISKNNINVILTTHDPYFIELGADNVIYNVSRDSEGATLLTSVSSGILGYPSHAETNYVIFGVPSTDYLLQLFQKADEDNQAKGFKNELIDDISVFDIRGALAHKRKDKPNITEDTKKKTIDYLREKLIT